MTDTADPPSPRSRVVTWHDPHEIVAGLAGRNGLEFIQALASGELPAAPILATIGDVRIVSATKGEVVLELEPAEYQYNPIGSVHGGVYATILDSACGCVVQTMLPEGVGYTSLDLSVKFIGAIRAGMGTVTCTGTVTHFGRRTALAEARLVSAEGKLLATATSSCLIITP